VEQNQSPSESKSGSNQSQVKTGLGILTKFSNVFIDNVYTGIDS